MSSPQRGSLKLSLKGALRRGRLPEPVREALRMERGERVLAHAPTRGGSHVVATSTALYVPVARAEGETEPRFLRLPWDRVEHASWKDGWLHVHEPNEAAEHHVRLTDPGSVPEAVRERVTATVIADQQSRLPGGQRVRIVGRRPVEGGEPRWSFVFEAGLDPDDPGLRAQAEQLLEGLRRQTGL